jgi:hypothetical protein
VGFRVDLSRRRCFRFDKTDKMFQRCIHFLICLSVLTTTLADHSVPLSVTGQPLVIEPSSGARSLDSMYFMALGDWGDPKSPAQARVAQAMKDRAEAEGGIDVRISAMTMTLFFQF